MSSAGELRPHRSPPWLRQKQAAQSEVPGLSRTVGGARRLKVRRTYGQSWVTALPRRELASSDSEPGSSQREPSSVRFAQENVFSALGASRAPSHSRCYLKQMTTRADDYRRNAEEAERRADRAISAYERSSYLRIAQGWRDLQAQAAVPCRAVEPEPSKSDDIGGGEGEQGS